MSSTLLELTARNFLRFAESETRSIFARLIVTQMFELLLFSPFFVDVADASVFGQSFSVDGSTILIAAALFSPRYPCSQRALALRLSIPMI